MCVEQPSMRPIPPGSTCKDQAVHLPLHGRYRRLLAVLLLLSLATINCSINTNTIENAIDSSAYQTQKKVARKSTLIYRKIEKDKIHAENQKMLTRL